MKAIYTCLFGNYDNLNPAPKLRGWDFILFTDSEIFDARGWNVRLVKKELSAEKESRRYKFLSHIYLREYRLVCYIDANMRLLKEPPLRSIWFRHPMRTSVVSEAARIIELGKADSKSVTDQINRYFSQGFPDNVGLFQNGFFVRSHSDNNNRLMEETWLIIKEHTHRDQIALPFAVWKIGRMPEGLTSLSKYNMYYRLMPHKGNEPVNVHHITPARSDKDLGRAINMIIEHLPENDWICLRDIDTFPPYHEAFIKQVESIANDPQGFDLIGCMTNRLGLEYQVEKPMFDEMDIKAHRQRAKEMATGGEIKPLGKAQTIGGVMMLFSKKTWLKAGKFPEGGIQIKGSFIDYHFSRAVMRSGGRLGIATGVYLFHAYRLDGRSIAHLV